MVWHFYIATEKIWNKRRNERKNIWKIGAHRIRINLVEQHAAIYADEAKGNREIFFAWSILFLSENYYYFVVYYCRVDVILYDLDGATTTTGGQTINAVRKCQNWIGVCGFLGIERKINCSLEKWWECRRMTRGERNVEKKNRSNPAVTANTIKQYTRYTHTHSHTHVYVCAVAKTVYTQCKTRICCLSIHPSNDILFSHIYLLARTLYRLLHIITRSSTKGHGHGSGSIRASEGCKEMKSQKSFFFLFHFFIFPFSFFFRRRRWYRYATLRELILPIFDIVWSAEEKCVVRIEKYQQHLNAFATFNTHRCHTAGERKIVNNHVMPFSHFVCGTTGVKTIKCTRRFFFVEYMRLE